MPNVTLDSGGLSAEIVEAGAELVSLRDSEGRDWLWNGDPAFWTGRAPLLFPMVGRAAGDRIRVGGRDYPLPQHGFARRSEFEVVEAGPARCVMRLVASAATRAAYPFEFRLDVAYALADGALKVEARVANPGEVPLPCSFGFHPAFRWPLPGAEGLAHEVRFEAEEPAPIRRLQGGLIEAASHPTPVEGRRLRLGHALFEADAIVFDRLASREVAFGPPGGPSVTVSFPAMPHFGLWTKPGAPFLCLEPWQGFAAPVGFGGEFADRPGVVAVAPGAERRFGMEVRVSG